jgi:hypothetical protein
MNLTIRLMLLIALAGNSALACAALGGDEAEISDDAAVTGMQLRAVAPGTRYRVHELRDETSNVTVREYVNPDGKVFGVAWDGPTTPDLSQALGPYFARYTSAAGQSLVRQLRSIDQPDFVLRASGHMRHFTGSAWVPNLVPADVDPAEVK